jgi:hypothetical protein
MIESSRQLRKVKYPQIVFTTIFKLRQPERSEARRSAFPGQKNWNSQFVGTLITRKTSASPESHSRNAADPRWASRRIIHPLGRRRKWRPALLSRAAKTHGKRGGKLKWTVGFATSNGG